jgi:ATP-binding cassette subfamily F protein 3
VLKKVERAGQQVLLTENLSLGFGERILVSGLNLAVSRGECLGVIGQNGSGKTTFLRALTGEVAPRVGKVIWGTKTKFGYYSQELSDLHDNNEVLQEFRRVAPSAESGEIRSFLARFLFQGEDVFKKVGDLSGGEKGRLALAKLVYSNVNVLILDEPTNHLDIPSREALEEALTIYDGTIIVVSHDRFFLDKLATQILFIGSGKCEHFDSNYTEFHDRNLNNAKFSKSAPPIKKQLNIESKKFSMEKTLSKNERRKLEARNSEIEKEIPLLEEMIAKLTFEMSNPEIASVASEYEKTNCKFIETENQLAKLFAEWHENLESLNRDQASPRV